MEGDPPSRPKRPRTWRPPPPPDTLTGFRIEKKAERVIDLWVVDDWRIDSTWLRKKRDGKKFYKPPQPDTVPPHTYLSRGFNKGLMRVEWKTVVRQPRTTARERAEMVSLPEAPFSGAQQQDLNGCHLATLQDLWPSIPELNGAGTPRFWA
tara:strand:+ start:339 stop:791 length:453 start_codon:yes stop_codon:yes gene_type:complete